MDIKLIRNSEDAVFSSISNGLVLQMTDDNYRFLDFIGKKMYILNSTTNEKYEISPEIKKRDPRRHRQQLPARRTPSGGTDYRAPDLPRFPAQRSGVLDIPFRPPDAVAAYPPERTGAGRLGRRPQDVGTPQHAAVHGFP